MNTPWPEKAEEHPALDLNGDSSITNLRDLNEDGDAFIPLTWKQYELAAKCVNLVARGIGVKVPKHSQAYGSFNVSLSDLEIPNALLIPDEETKI